MQLSYVRRVILGHILTHVSTRETVYMCYGAEARKFAEASTAPISVSVTAVGEWYFE